MLWYLPLERLDERYTALMDDQIVRELERRKTPYRRIYGETLTGKIETGAFLDSEGTNFFKASQIQQVAAAFRAGEVSDGDQFFVSDLWFPGIEAIPYMAMFRDLTVEVWGIMHAGSWTDTDFVRALEPWARHVERGWFEMATGVFVGSEFHAKDIVLKGRSEGPLHVTGLVFDTAEVRRIAGPPVPKEPLVVMAGRLDDEKQPWHFDYLASKIGSARFVKTYELDLDKEAYFKLLNRASVIFSSALQENFGYAVLEAATLGVTPVVPDRLAYTEMWPSSCRYATLPEAEALVRKYLRTPMDVSEVPRHYDSSLSRMLDTMRA